MTPQRGRTVVYASNLRTLLAWARTVVSMIGYGEGRLIGARETSR